MPLKIQDFKKIKPLTKGAYGKVYLATKKTDDTKLYAIKRISKDDLKNKNLIRQINAERNALAISHCPYIVHLYYSLQTKKSVYLIMEYLCGGDLKTLIIMSESLSIEHASIYCKEIMIALQYLHNHKIIHRDLKPDNILISNDGHLKLTDFGLSKVTLSGQNLQLNDILYTPSRKKCEQNLDYLRTPNQLYSLMDKLEFMKTPARFPKRIPQTEFKKKLSRQIKKIELPDIWDTSLPNNNFMHYDNKENHQTIFDSFDELKIDDSLKELSVKFEQNNIHNNKLSKTKLNSLTSSGIPEFKNLCPINESTPLKPKKVKLPNEFSNRSTDVIQYTQECQLDLTNDGRVLGTPDYLPPEILIDLKNRLQGPPVDWWALGVIVFEMLMGYTPFFGETVDEVFNNITLANIKWPVEHLDSSAEYAIKGLLLQNPTERWGFNQLNGSEFIDKIRNSTEMPFIPVIVTSNDTGYHDARNQLFDFSMNHDFIGNIEEIEEF